MSTCRIDLNRLVSHPKNSNVMSQKKLAKLVEHIRRSGRYPPLIVRPIGSEQYQLLDGHHRVKALQELGHAQALCVVWDTDDAEALMLLGTLNRLQGQDDPAKRAELLAELAAISRQSLSQLSQAWPEETAQLDRLMRLHETPVTLAAPLNPAEMPQAVHFFLTGDQRRKLDQALGNASENPISKEERLLILVDLAERHPCHPSSKKA